MMTDIRDNTIFQQFLIKRLQWLLQAAAQAAAVQRGLVADGQTFAYEWFWTYFDIMPFTVLDTAAWWRQMAFSAAQRQTLTTLHHFVLSKNMEENEAAHVLFWCDDKALGGADWETLRHLAKNVLAEFAWLPETPEPLYKPVIIADTGGFLPNKRAHSA